VRQVAAKNSATLLLGRHSALASAAYGYTGNRWSAQTSPANVLSVPVSWASSNSNVVSIRNDTAIARSIGNALLIASACGATDTVSVRVVNAGYRMSLISVPGGATAWPRALNDSGVAVVYVAGAPAVHYLWKAGTVTPLTGCHALDLNDRSQVLCLGPGPVVWENGMMSTLDTISYAYGWINDAGHVAGLVAEGTPFLWKGPGTFTALDPGAAATLVAGMNELDDVVGSVGQLPARLGSRCPGAEASRSRKRTSAAPPMDSDQMKSLDWVARRAAFIDTVPATVVTRTLKLAHTVL
jgi:hypothetical protein